MAKTCLKQAVSEGENKQLKRVSLLPAATVLDMVDLSDSYDWSAEDQQAAQDLLNSYSDVFFSAQL